MLLGLIILVAVAQPSWQRLAERGAAAQDADRAQEAFDALSAAIADPGFSAASGEERHTILRRAAYAALALKQFDVARGLFRRAAAMPERIGKDFFGVYVATANLGDKRATVLALTDVMRFAVTDFRDEDETPVFQVFQRARELAPGDGARFDLLEAAYTAGYRNPLGEVLGPDWIDLAGMLLQKGETAKAARVLDEIDLPSDLIDVRADKRFAALVDAQPKRYDVEAAAHRRVQRLTALTAKKPRSLRVAFALAGANKDAGAPQAALAILDRALVRAGFYGDEERLINWVHDERARVLWRLTRFDEAIVEFQRGLTTEDRGPNISQRVNLAEHYIFLNKPELALTTLDRLGDNATPYGRMAWEYQRLTAANELGDDTLEQEALDYMRAHEPDAPQALRAALVVTGNLDEAARVFIGELDDPMFRGAALHGLQQFSSGSKTQVPPRWEANWKRLQERQDVKAAVARAGRVYHYDLPVQ